MRRTCPAALSRIKLSGTRSVHALAVSLALLALQGSLVSPASASWPTTLNVDVPICTSPGDQNIPMIVSDGAGGGIIVWRNGSTVASDLIAQRVDAGGTPLWTPNGVTLIGTFTTGSFAVIADDAGGAIVAYEDRAMGTAPPDIRAQRVDATGAVLWGPAGVPVGTAVNGQQSPKIVSDGSGGALITWTDNRAAPDPFTVRQDIYAQRLDAAGNPQWPLNGVLVCGATGGQFNPLIVSDGAGGGIITWLDNRGASNDVYAQRLDASGTTQWATDGVPVAASSDSELPFGCVSDGGGGAIVEWLRQPPASPNQDVYMQRLDGAGNALWAPGGVGVCTDPGTQLSPTLASDGAGGAIAAWQDTRSLTSTEIFTQRVDGTGAPQWTTNGVRIRGGIPGTANFSATIIPDGAGGAVIAWPDNRPPSADLDVFAQRVTSGGIPLWTPNGVPVCSAAGNQGLQTMIADGVGGAIFTWLDRRNGNFDVYAQRISPSGFQGGSATDRFGSVAGRVTAQCPGAGTPLLGVTVDAFAVGSGDLLGTTTTDANGNYVMGVLLVGDYTITLVTPLGYTAASNDVPATVSDGQTTTTDFDLSCTPASGSPAASGFWKHQFGIATGGNGNPQIDAATLCDYLDLIEEHFNNNALNEVIIYDPPGGATCEQKLEIGKSLLNLGGSLAPIDKARQQVLSLLLNVAANYVRLFDVVSKDGATATQAITYCDQLIDNPSGDKLLAASIGDKINSGQMVNAGVIPLTTAQIAYRDGLALRTFRVASNPVAGARAFQFTLGRPGAVRLNVFDVSGRLVSRLVNESMDAGAHTVPWAGGSSAHAGTGVYFARLEADGGSKALKVICIAQ